MSGHPNYLFCQYSSEDEVLPRSPEGEAEGLKAKLIPEPGVVIATPGRQLWRTPHVTKILVIECCDA